MLLLNIEINSKYTKKRDDTYFYETKMIIMIKSYIKYF